MKYVVFPAFDEDRLSRLRHLASTSSTIVNAATESDAAEAATHADAFLGKITAEILHGCRQLRWVQSPTASLEHYLFPALIEHPCQLTNMRGIFSDVIADQVMGYVICLARNLHTYIRNQLTRTWEPVGGEGGRVSFATGPGQVNPIDRQHRHLGDQTMGIVGLGGIGLEVARRAKAFGMRLLGVDPRRPEQATEIDWLGPPETALPELLGASDFVVIAAPHTPATAGLFGLAQFQQMKRDAFLINVGRGAIVRLNDLCQALAEGRIAGAALDVFEEEPLPAEHPLWNFPNVILTPHIAGYSPRIAERHFTVIAENLRRFEADEPLLNVVDKRSWY